MMVMVVVVVVRHETAYLEPNKLQDTMLIFRDFPRRKLVQPPGTSGGMRTGIQIQGGFKRGAAGTRRASTDPDTIGTLKYGLLFLHVVRWSRSSAYVPFEPNVSGVCSWGLWNMKATLSSRDYLCAVGAYSIGMYSSCPGVIFCIDFKNTGRVVCYHPIMCVP